jgi:hypothetical protein
MLFGIKIKMWNLWKKYVLNMFTHDREEFHIGYTTTTDYTKQENIDKIEAALIGLGYQPNYFSFQDKEQITSMRKMYIDTDGFWRQKHVRVHSDSEIRGHDELCYEESAIDHVNGVNCIPINDEERMNIVSVLEHL